MRIATWNLNNRVGKVRFRPEAAKAAVTLGADVLVFTEFFPRQHEPVFCETLKSAGWKSQLLSVEPTEVANRVLMASRLPLRPLEIELPAFDGQFAPNVLGASCCGFSILGVRVPAYKSAWCLSQAWEWLESTARTLVAGPAVILGDLNVSISRTSRAGRSLGCLLESGWRRAPVNGPAFFGHRGIRSEIDHILVTRSCVMREPVCVVERDGFALAGVPGALSDHGAVMCTVEARS